MKRWLSAALVACLAGAFGATLWVTPAGLALEESVGLTWLFQARGPVLPPPEVAIVGIGRRAAKRLGLPAAIDDWPREVLACAVDQLAALRADMIVFDVDFADAKPAASASAPSARFTPPWFQRACASAGLSGDRALAGAMARVKRAVIAQRLEQDNYPSGGADGPALVVNRLVPVPLVLAEAALGMAPFPLPKVPARVAKFWPFAPQAGDAPTLPMVALQVYALAPLGELAARLDRAGADDAANLAVDGVTNSVSLRQVMGNLRDRLRGPGEFSDLLASPIGRQEAGDPPEPAPALAALVGAYGSDGPYYLNFYGPAGAIPTIRFEDLFAEPVQVPAFAAALSGRAVFVGASDPTDSEQIDGHYTVYTSRTGVDLSGVEIVATAFANLLSGATLLPLGLLEGFALLFMVGTAIGASAALLSTVRAIAAVAVLAASYFAGAVLAFEHRAIWLPVAIPLLIQLPSGLLGGVIVHEHDRIWRAIRYFLPESEARKFAKKGVPPTESEMVHGTCLRTDVEAYTRLSEKLDVAELAALMNRYYDALSAPVVASGGTIVDFVADEMMCAWHAPAPTPETRRNACLAALAIRDAVRAFNAGLSDRQLPTRIGLHAGCFALVYLGGHDHKDFGVTGDIPNTASRIEALNKQLGTCLLASGTTVQGLDELVTRRIGRFQLFGKAETIVIHELIGIHGQVDARSQELCARFDRATRALEGGRWVEAIELLDALLGDFPADGPARFLRTWCAEVAARGDQQNPPTAIRLDSK